MMNIKWKFNQISTIALCIALGVSVAACGSGSKDKETENAGIVTETEKEKISMKDLCDAMSAADDSLPDMITVKDTDEEAEDTFAYLSDFEYSKVQRYFMSYASEDGNTQELAVIEVKDKKDVQDAEDSLKKHQESRIKLFEQYEPEKVAEVKEGITFTKDNYAVLIISSSKDSVKKAFETAIAGQ